MPIFKLSEGGNKTSPPFRLPAGATQPTPTPLPKPQKTAGRQPATTTTRKIPGFLKLAAVLILAYVLATIVLPIIL